MDDWDRLAQQLKRSLNAPGNGGVFNVLLTLLAAGNPVPNAAIARALGVSEAEVARILTAIPSAECDEAGNLIGAGLSLRPTPHQFEIDGKRLYTWCALDTLMFPVLLGRTARVTSPCAATGVAVHLLAGLDAIQDLEPKEAVVSLQLFEETRDVRNAFCRQSNFFASADAAGAWQRASGRQGYARRAGRRVRAGAGAKARGWTGFAVLLMTRDRHHAGSDNTASSAAPRRSGHLPLVETQVTDHSAQQESLAGSL